MIIKGAQHRIRYDGVRSPSHSTVLAGHDAKTPAWTDRVARDSLATEATATKKRNRFISQREVRNAVQKLGTQPTLLESSLSSLRTCRNTSRS